MAKEYEFNSGQLYALYDVFGVVPPAVFEAMSKHLALRAVFQFTAEEKVAARWSEEIAPIGLSDRVTFESDVALTRRLTDGQRKYAAEIIQRGAVLKAPVYFEKWLLPALITIGYPLQEANWEDDDE